MCLQSRGKGKGRGREHLKQTSELSTEHDLEVDLTTLKAQPEPKPRVGGLI